MDAEVQMMDGIRLYTHEGEPMGELSKQAGNLRKCDMTLEINGEHSLSITTSRRLEVGVRAVTQDAQGKWWEWVVDEPEETHDSGPHAVGDYHLIWSLQYDLQGVHDGTARQPGMESSCDAATALSAALSGTRRWRPGVTDVTTTSQAIMAFDSAWDRLNTVVKYWGGEVEADIQVGPEGVTSRKVNLLRHIGSSEATRRLEWRHDLTSITRTPSPGPYYCRVYPYGSGESELSDDGETTFEWKLDITEAGHATPYLSDPDAELLFRVSDGNGGWEYPAIGVTYSTDDPDELLYLAVLDLQSHTRPKVSYSASVSQFAEAGMSTDGIALGDEIQILDYGFNEDYPLRVQERVLRMEVDLLGSSDTRLNIGRLQPSLERIMKNMVKSVGFDAFVGQAIPYEDFKFDFEIPKFDDLKIDPIDMGDLLKQLEDRLKLDLDSIKIPEFEKPEIPKVEVPDWSNDIGKLKLDIKDLTSKVNSIGAVTVPDYEPIGSVGNVDIGNIGVGSTGIGVGSTGIGGDGWIHQIDGLTVNSATVNFVTSGSASEESKETIKEAIKNAARSWGSTITKSKTGSAKTPLFTKQ